MTVIGPIYVLGALLTMVIGIFPLLFKELADECRYEDSMVTAVLWAIVGGSLKAVGLGLTWPLSLPMLTFLFWKNR